MQGGRRKLKDGLARRPDIEWAAPHFGTTSTLKRGNAWLEKAVFIGIGRNAGYNWGTIFERYSIGHTMDSPSREEKGHSGVTDAHKYLEQEVFGKVGTTSGSEAGSIVKPDKLTVWAIKVRTWAKNFGAEENGIERIPTEGRTNHHPFALFSVFSSANTGVATFALGVLGPNLFFLGLTDSFLCILFFNLIGAIPPALITALGPKLGIRTMTIPRYSFGWWPAKVLAFINLLNQLGWAMVNTIAAAVVLYDLSDLKLPLAVAVLIIALVAMAIGLFGYRVIHIYERYSYIVMYVAFAILAGFGAKHFVNTPMGTGSTEMANVLTFGTAIIGFQFAWLPIAADYCVRGFETPMSIANPHVLDIHGREHALLETRHVELPRIIHVAVLD